MTGIEGNGAPEALKQGDPGYPVRPHRFPIRSALWVGFGLIFALWILSTYYLEQRLAELETREREISGQSARNGLDTRPDLREYYQFQIAETRLKINQAFEEYQPVFNSVETAERRERLQREMDEYWGTLAPPLDSPASGVRPLDAGLYLRQYVIPKRDEIIRLSGEAADLTQDNLREFFPNRFLNTAFD